MPAFASPISSLTVAKGRDATLKCVVDNLGDYRVIESIMFITKFNNVTASEPQMVLLVSLCLSVI